MLLIIDVVSMTFACIQRASHRSMLHIYLMHYAFINALFIVVMYWRIFR